MNMDIFILIFYIFTQNNGSSPCEKNKTNEITTKQTQYAPPYSLKLGIKYQSKPTICGNNRSLIRSPRRFYNHSLSLYRQDVITQSAARLTVDAWVTSSSLSLSHNCRKGLSLDSSTAIPSLHLTQEGQLLDTGGFTGINVLLVLRGLRLSKNSARRLTDGSI